MKPFILYCLLAVVVVFQAGAQAPQGINYQGVARDSDGKAVASKRLSVRISILKSSATGEVEFAEVHQVTTNQFGLFTLVIGEGLAVTGMFGYVSWAVGNKWLQIEMDVDGGENFKIMGTQQLMSVPYAFYAQYSGNGLKAGAGISIASGVVSNTGDTDNNPTNELITGVSFGSDHKLKITDAGGTHEADLSLLLAPQDLSHVLTLGNDAGAQKITNLAAPTNNNDAATKAYVDAHPDNDNNPTNEAQTLSRVANAITLSSVSGTGGGSVTLNDDDPVNEIQDLSLASNILKINKNAAATNINLAPYLDNTDNQTLTYAPATNNLSIAGGNAVTVTQTLNQVLTQSNDAGAKKITNLAAPTVISDAATKKYVDDADAALASLIASTYAFKTSFSYTNGGTLVENNRILPFTVEEFDDFNVLASNTFTATTAGIYVFTVDGTYAATVAGGQLSFLYNGVKYPIAIVQPWGGVFGRFNSTMMFKLTAGQTVSLVADNILVGGQFSGGFYGYKL